jgi:zinc/manganese transport system substrate-binding protein
VESKSLARYDQLISEIKRKYGGTPVGASESIVTPLAEGLDLELLTPESFLDAISEGVDPTGKDKAAVDRQISSREIKVYKRRGRGPDRPHTRDGAHWRTAKARSALVSPPA